MWSLNWRQEVNERCEIWEAEEAEVEKMIQTSSE